MSKSSLEIAVRRIRPDEEEPDRLPLRWSTVARLLAFTAPHRRQRNTLLCLCVFRAMALPGLAWLVGVIINGPVTTGDGPATFRALALFTAFFIVADVALYWRIRLAHQIGENVLRDLRDNFAAEVWKELGYGGQSALFAKTELPATIVILASMSLLVLVQNNRKAFFLNHLIILIGLLVVFASTFLFSQNHISAPLWAMLDGIGLYLAYVPFNCLIFERLIATYRQPGNVGFIMYVADAIGYLGSIAVLLMKECSGLEMAWSQFLITANLGAGLIGLALIALSAAYFWPKQPSTT